MAKKAAKAVFRVGLLGESPNDTKAVARLLAPHYGGRVEFFPLVDNITGDNLEMAGTFRLLRREYQYERPNLVVVIRDLDALETDKVQLRKRNDYFKKVKKQVGESSLFLLNIYSIEALIAADIDLFNDHYEVQCVVPADVMTIEKPVEVLKAATQRSKLRYLEGHCGDLLARASYDTLLRNCRYFRRFDADFAARLPVASAA
ncbi:MAG: hypothetical protein M3Y12_01105 [Bacteroidota bacterium]|nr:hypothetical protein [Bacteroidota bacterium]